MLTQFFGAVQNGFPYIAVYFRVFLCEVDGVLPLGAVYGAVWVGSMWMSDRLGIFSKPLVEPVGAMNYWWIRVTLGQCSGVVRRGDIFGAFFEAC